MAEKARGKRARNSSGKTLQPQSSLNGEIHDWYRIIHGYTDHLVADLIREFGLTKESRVLDAFSGTATTLVECMKHGIESVGIDANPSSVFAGKVKTRWSLDPDRLLALKFPLTVAYNKRALIKDGHASDPSYRYLRDGGFIKRGWISEVPARKVMWIKGAIKDLDTPVGYQNALMLALMAETVTGASNVKFGPELYCGKPKRDAKVLAGVLRRLDTMASDLRVVKKLPHAPATLVYGDARACDTTLRRLATPKFDAVICSPPYPTEHDYTRNARLELALLELVTSQDTLQRVKRSMIRSHTKGIYIGDNDARLVLNVEAVESLASRIDKKAQKLTHGFGRYYSSVIREYFGGMKRHFRTVKRILKKDAMCAYVVGDQCSYLKEFVATAEILSVIAESVGFTTVEIRRWRGRRSTTGRRRIDENILILKNRRRPRRPARRRAS